MPTIGDIGPFVASQIGEGGGPCEAVVPRLLLCHVEETLFVGGRTMGRVTSVPYVPTARAETTGGPGRPKKSIR